MTGMKPAANRSGGGGAGRDPLAGVERLLIDGSNLLHRMARDRSSAGPRPPAALIGRLRAAIPAATRIELLLDGAPEHGLAGVRIANGLTVRHSGRDSADYLLDRLVADAIGSGGTAEAAAQVADSLLVVTDDRELSDRIRRRGARVAGATWLIGRLDRERLASPATGGPRPPKVSGPASGSARASASGSMPSSGSTDDEPDRPGWQPGRGATRKTGNPRRRARMPR